MPGANKHLSLVEGGIVSLLLWVPSLSEEFLSWLGEIWRGGAWFVGSRVGVPLLLLSRGGVPLLLLLLLKKLFRNAHMFTDGCKEMIFEILLFCGYVRVCRRENLKMQTREHHGVHAVCVHTGQRVS